GRCDVANDISMAVAPVDRPSGDRVGPGIAMRQVQRVRRGFIDRTVAADGECRGDVVDVNDQRIDRSSVLSVYYLNRNRIGAVVGEDEPGGRAGVIVELTVVIQIPGIVQVVAGRSRRVE